MEKRTPERPTAVGGSSLLTIFAVLSLTVFALLSITAARAGENLSHRSAAAVEGYYAADCAAEEILARLRSGEIPPGVTEEDGVYAYSCPISHTQSLEVEVAVEGRDYTILRWQAVSAEHWQAEDRLPVWDGN